MKLFLQLFPQRAATPGRGFARKSDVENLTDLERGLVLDALEWSDLDSSHNLVKRVDLAIERLSKRSS
jgi:hypothetical protein